MPLSLSSLFISFATPSGFIKIPLLLLISPYLELLDDLLFILAPPDNELQLLVNAELEMGFESHNRDQIGRAHV